MDYKNTIITPKTSFPMKAGLPAREPGMLEHWNQEGLYQQMLEKNKALPRFVLHDGPPFSNGDIHMGTAMNKVLKDFIIRSHAMMGFYTPYVPGWDNHGMPIESAIIKKNKLNRKAMPVPEFRSACEAFAEDYIQRQMTSFRRLGVVGDWEHPYRTMDKHFEAEEVKVFGAMYEKGYIYKGLKPVYWCPKDETALAEAEIEYQDDPCTSVYVKFPIKYDFGKLADFDLSRTYFLIWTTTIWTLPGNMAICLHPRESYVLAKAENGETYILAEALLHRVMQVANIENYEIIARYPGSFFENMIADHPFLPKTSRLVNAEYVTMDSGTGCVHTAPGFGADDYQTCMRYGIELVVPVDDRGRHTVYAGKYAGLTTDESNPIILKDMEESGMLFASEQIVHSYPHCWRCKNPIIFRATPQWFCSVESFKEQAVDACRNIRWLPAWGGDRMESMIRERADWCISRQRRWGLPIPVFYCKNCGKPVCTPETISHISQLFDQHGSNIWFEQDAEALIPSGLTCPHCGGAHFDKETDTLDGWFDSGSTHYASLRRNTPELWPADVYLEGADQYRGWFQSSLLTSVGALGQGAPFKQVITHGWTVDGQGRAMHKSLGNGMDPNELIKEYGADIVRLWAGSADYHADMRCSKDIFKQLSQNYLKFRNTARYCLGNLNEFDANHLVLPQDMEELDKWVLTRLNSLIAVCRKAYENYEFHVVSHAINDFCVVELSSFYLDIIKDRLYCEEPGGLRRRSAQTALYLIVDTLAKLFAPILAFTCDEIWQAMPHREGDDTRNILLNQMPENCSVYILDSAAMEKWGTVMKLRQDVNGVLELARAEKRIGKALEAHVSLQTQDAALTEACKNVNLAEVCIVSSCAWEAPEAAALVGQGSNFPTLTIGVTEARGGKCPRCWMHTETPDEHGLCPRCARVVAKLDVEI
ncbi:MAG TPA: isoleucine--tRNA ligase [Candidatus Faecousia intestinigallinarum]|nr:isoleucine--tRNA ligase [Candidatus Faecousia intestinigallinarum]